MLCYTSIRPTSPSEIQETYVMLHLYTPHFPERNSGKVCYVTLLYAPLPRAKFRKSMLCYTSICPTSPSEIQEKYVMLHFYTPHFPERNSGKLQGSAICIPKNVFGAVRTSRQCNLYPKKRFWRSKNLKAVQCVPQKTFLAQ